MLAARLRDNPLIGLIWLESFAMVIAYATDVGLSIAHILGVPAWNPGEWLLYTLLFATASAAIVAIPHHPNRRYLAIPIAILAISILTMRPSSAYGPAVLLIVLGSRVTFAFGFRGAAAAWLSGVLFLLVSAYVQYESSTSAQRLPEAIVYAFGYALLLALIFGIIGVTWLYSTKASANAASAERARIALDIHDSVGHGLTTLAVQLQNANQLWAANPEKAEDYLRRSMAMTENLLADVRETVGILHDDVQRVPAPFAMLLDRLRADFESTNAARIEWNSKLDVEPSGRLAMAVYRVLQEALTNVVRHARASHVVVSVSSDEQSIRMCVADDGVGVARSVTRGHGLPSMRLRIEDVRGTFNLVSTPENGTRIEVQCPMEQRS